MEPVKDIIAGVIAASVILFCALQAQNGLTPVVTRLLQSRLAAGVGTWSYSLYLTHCLVLREMQTIQQLYHLPGVAALCLRVFVGLPLAFGAAYLFYLVFEAPFLRSRSGRKTTLLPCSAETTQAAASSAP